MLLKPDREDVRQLVISDVRESGNRHRPDQGSDCLPVVTGQRRRRTGGSLDPRRQITVPAEIRRKRPKHEQSRRAKANVPAVPLAKKSAEQWPGDRTEIDARAKDREAPGAPRLIVTRVNAADLRRNVALEQPRTDDQERKGEQKGAVEGHGE